jgi:hypothetical protein
MRNNIGHGVGAGARVDLFGLPLLLLFLLLVVIVVVASRRLAQITTRTEEVSGGIANALAGAVL